LRGRGGTASHLGARNTKRKTRKGLNGARSVGVQLPKKESRTGKKDPAGDLFGPHELNHHDKWEAGRDGSPCGR